MYVAFDDTDSIESMCTTYLVTEVLDAMREYDLIGLPRLVRLNPAVPWKTRGNGAVCMRFGQGRGQAMLAGHIRDTPVFCYPRCELPADRDVVMDRCSRLIKKWARTQEDASPGLVVSERRPSAKFYWRAVRGIVEKVDVVKELDSIGASRFELAGGRGVIGATAAMAWRPRDRTFEVITYRDRARWGTERHIEDASVAAMDVDYPSTFNNFDHNDKRRAISPHTPCPVLFGIRGDDPFKLPSAMLAIRSESVDRWVLYMSNQGTDDHIIRDWRTPLPDRSYEVIGTVITDPDTIPGGHVVMRVLLDRTGQELSMTAYEPSKSFRDVVRQLKVGDRIRALGELRNDPRTLNLEKVEVLSLAPQRRKVSNPICPQCGKSMQSQGAQGGYRCRKGHAKAPASAAIFETLPRTIATGWYEPPVCARRHLSKPLKRDRPRAELVTL